MRFFCFVAKRSFQNVTVMNSKLKQIFKKCDLCMKMYLIYMHVLLKKVSCEDHIMFSVG